MPENPHIIRSSDVFREPDSFPLSVYRHENHGAGQLHAHEFHELVVLFGGSGTHITSFGAHPLKTGDVFLFRGDMVHGYADTRNVSLVNILFQPNQLALPLHHLNDLPGYHALFRIEPRLRAAGRVQHQLQLTEVQLTTAARHIAAIEEELNIRTPGYRFAACTHLMNLLTYLSRCYDQSQLPEQRPLMRLGEVLGYMEIHRAQDIRMPMLAAMAGMSESTLTRRFRKVMGRSPIEHLIRLRIERARHLLASPDLNITEIAHECGFADSNYFSRCFRSTTGVSPRDYRARLVHTA